MLDRYRPLDNNIQNAGEIGNTSKSRAILVLGRVYIAPAATADSVDITDTRVRGGGITDDPYTFRTKLTNAQKVAATALWDESSWDGTPAILSGSIVVNIPKSRLDTNGGPFTEEQIKEIVEKYTPAGVIPLIKYTDN